MQKVSEKIDEVTKAQENFNSATEDATEAIKQAKETFNEAGTFSKRRFDGLLVGRISVEKFKKVKKKRRNSNKTKAINRRK